MRYESAEVRFHQQDDTLSCGEAAAQMMLASLGAGTLPQRTIGGGQLPPAALSHALNMTLQKLGMEQRFTPASDPCLDSGLRRIVDVLSRRMPVATSIWSGEHWVVVRGVLIGDDDRLRGFFVDDPSSDAPPGYDHGPCDLCGTGLARGSGDVYVTLAAWRQYYWQQPDSDGTPPGYVTIIPAEAAAGAGAALKTDRIATGGESAPAGSERSAVSIVEAALETHQLRTQGALKDRLKDIRVEPVYGLPYLVAVQGGKSRKVAPYGPLTSRYRVNLCPKDGGQPVGQATVDPVAGAMLAVEVPCSDTYVPIPKGAQTLELLELFSDHLTDYLSLEAIMQRRFTIRSARPNRADTLENPVRIDADPETTLYLGFDPHS